MTTEPQVEPEVTDDNGDADEETKNNLLDQLRSERAEAMEDIETLIQVPGYDRIPLLVQYKMIDGRLLDKISRKVFKQTRDRWERNITAAIDVMIAAATGVFVEFEGEVVPLTLNGQPIMGYTTELAECLGFKATSAREIVIGTFQNKEMHIANHSMKLQRWFGDTSASVDEAWLGE